MTDVLVHCHAEETSCLVPIFLGASFSLHLWDNRGFRCTFLCLCHVLLEYICSGWDVEYQIKPQTCSSDDHENVYVTSKPVLSLLLPYRMLHQAFVVSLDKICVANTKFYVHTFCIWRCQMQRINKMELKTDIWLLMTLMNTMIDLALKWRHGCYQVLTLKYPARYYSLKNIRFLELF
jgi:hypothetical protein